VIVGIFPQRVPLPIEQKLPETVHQDFIGKRAFEFAEGHGLPLTDVFGPIRETCPAECLADGHERGVIGEPVFFLMLKALKLLSQMIRPAATVSPPCRAEHRRFRRDDLAEIDMVRFA
jgi:hypothetical protein